MVVVGNNGSLVVYTLMYVMNQSVIQDDRSYNYYLMQLGKETPAERCYGMYGCFKLDSPWTSEHRPVSLFPSDIREIDPNYFLHTRSNPEKGVHIDVNEYEYVSNSNIDVTKPIYVITHGYMEGGSIHWIQRMVQELLSVEDCNIIIVDWHGGSSPPYTQAVANIRLIGRMTAHLLGDIAQHTERYSLEHVHCIGHSLGAHLCGYVGYTVQDEFNLTLGRITGLDPAEPHFAKTHRPVRLDRSAAQYVDIIHTDATQFITGGLGITESIGHVDYFPNGGNRQPGCEKSVVQFINDQKGSFFNGMKKYLGCNHERSHQLFIETINPKCTFLSVMCTSYQDFLDGNCWGCGKYGERCIQFGHQGMKYYNKYYGPGLTKSLNQYLLTGSKRPYCKGHYRIGVRVSDNEDSKKHGGEIGQLVLTIHNTTDGTGHKSHPVGFIGGYYEPGGSYMRVVATDEVKHLRAIEIEWKYNSSIFNPLTWRLLTTPMIYLTDVVVESLEGQQKITVCPKEKKPLVTGSPQLMIPTYC
ncbi:pancreatic triacylglycerol lipase-like [Sitophilus oryzae]|uniref:Pancreatic triacylglycerol lipase-like n=1 Tax=Sitophilus oryzae TaxID=7048 RepID=A0A6J2YLW7_SITOR|nr:pancreatic triacylglycerol lipase-like [Sitophilus oryzae]